MYITEPPTKGKVVLRTSYGDVDIELWPKEAPLACRNFVQLAMEGYYDNMIFHRVIKELIVQTGSPSGDGTDGESIYDEGTFKDEFHQRLKFNHRGQVAMANDNVPNTNRSQFFITLIAKAEWLDKMHTIFGKVTGNTIFNVLRMGECETDKDDRPIEPPRLLGVDVLDNPFDDIVPRTVARAAQQAAAAKRAEEEAKAARAARAKKATNLLSFGEDEDGEDEGLGPKLSSGKGGAPAAAGKPGGSGGGIRAAHELLKGDAALADEIAEEDVELVAKPKQAAAVGGSSSSAAGTKRSLVEPNSRADLSSNGRAISHDGDDGADGEDSDFASSMRAAMRQKRAKYEGASSAAASDNSGINSSTVSQPAAAAARAPSSSSSSSSIAAQASEYQRLRDELRASRKAVLAGGDLAKKQAEAAESSLLTPLQQMRSKYKPRGDPESKARESSTLAKLAAFQSSLKAMAKAMPASSAVAADSSSSSSSSSAAAAAESYHGQVLEDDDAAEKDEDGGEKGSAAWMAHKLKFKKHIDDKFRAGDDGLVSIDTALETEAERPTSYGDVKPSSSKYGGHDRRPRDEDRKGRY